jgi:hypothetical protein
MPIYLGPVGLTFEQTARLNVVAHPPNPCAGTLGFIDPSGIAIIPPNPQQPGQKSVDLPGGQVVAMGQGYNEDVLSLFRVSIKLQQIFSKSFSK